MKWIILSGMLLATATAQAQNNAEMPSTADTIYKFVDQIPEPNYNLGAYLSENITYPESARRANKEGRILIRFVVDVDGRIYNAEVWGENRLGYGLEEEALRVINSMPLWQPGMQDGKAVKVYYTLPLSFKLARKRGRK